MRPKTLKVFSAPHAKVSAVGQPRNTPKRFVGWEWQPGQSLSAREAQREFLHPDEQVHTGEFVLKDEPEVVQFHTDHITNLREGDWLPADEETAHAANISWSK